MINGTVYCLHFARPISLGHTTQHYVGFAERLEQRIADHQAGRGARLTQVAVERGIAFEVVWSVPGTRTFERVIKQRKATPRYCPVCCAFHGWRCRPVAIDARQLLLPFAPMIDEEDDFPLTPARSMDWYEVTHLRAFRDARAALRPAQTALPDDWDSGFL